MPSWGGNVSGDDWMAFDPVEHSTQELDRRCSFCGLEEDVAGPLIGGEAAFICETCLGSCNQVLEQDRQRRQERILAAMPVPRTLRRHLDCYIVGQERPKKVLSVAVYNHYKRLLWAARGHGVELAKSNILLVGPSGSGKSHMAECLARCVDVPFVSVDATTLTASGFAGDDAASIVGRLLAACDYDAERAARGIIYIDEIDKLAARAGATGGRDVSGQGAQEGLLKLLEGQPVTVTIPGKGRQEVTLDTRQILFVCGGAFQGLDAAVREEPGVGFVASVADGANSAEAWRDDPAAALQAYGLLPELVGRLPVVESLDDLGTEELVRVLTEPRNALVRQYQSMLARDGCELEVTASGLEAVAERARQRGAGARGLRSVLEEILLEPMFAIPAAEGAVTRLILDADAVYGGAPHYEFAECALEAG